MSAGDQGDRPDPVLLRRLREWLLGRGRLLLPRTVQGTLLLVLLVVVIPRELVEVGHYYDLYQQRRAQEFESNLEVARAVVTTFGSYVRDILDQELAIGVAVTAAEPPSGEQVNRLLGTSALAHPSIRHYAWIDPAGRVVASSQPAIVGLDLANRPYFREIARGQEWAVSDLFQGQLNGEPRFVIARGFRDGQGSLQGVMAADMDPQLLNEVLEIQRGPGGTVVVIDRQGQLVYIHPEVNLPWDRRDLRQTEPLLARALTGEEVTGVFKSSVDRLVRMGAYSPIRSIGWVARASEPEDGAMAPVFQGILREGSLDAVVIIVALAVAVLLGRYITVPTSRLRQHAAALGRGDLGHRVEVGGPAELEELGSGFNWMAEEIQTREAEREQLLREVQQRAAELDAIIESVNEGIVVSDLHQRVRRVNGREVELLGLRSREEIPSSIPEFMRFNPRTPDGRRLGTDELPGPRALRGETFSDLEMVVDTADGQERHLMVAGAPVRDARGRTVLSVTLARDVTALRRSEREREDWVRMVSHDLRGPLTAVIGQAEILRRFSDRPEVVQKGAATIVASGRRMSSMIQDLTDIARLEMGKMEPELQEIDLRHFVGDYLETSRGSMEVERIRVDAPKKLPRVRADPDWLARVLGNLLSNALKYSAPGTEVLVALRAQDGWVLCGVADRGPGIPPEDLPRLFERYYRGRGGAAARKEGLGLGLYITRLFVESMGGRISVTSEVGKGSTFTVSLPTVRRSESV